MPENKSQLTTQTFQQQADKKVSRMHQAIEIQAYAAKFGFDWSTLAPIFEKLEEEIQELKDECEDSQSLNREIRQQRIEDELGDVLFCCMNLARFLKVDPEKALESTNKKFNRRFAFIEEQVAQMGKDMEELSLAALDDIWSQAKAKGL